MKGEARHRDDGEREGTEASALKSEVGPREAGHLEQVNLEPRDVAEAVAHQILHRHDISYKYFYY